MGGLSSEGSAIAKSDGVEMLVDGDRVMGDPGIMTVSEILTNFDGVVSPFGSPKGVATGVAPGSFWFTPVGLGFSVVNRGGGGRPSQPRSRRSTISWNFVSGQMSLSS